MGEVSRGESRDPRKDLRGSRGRRVGVCEVAQPGPCTGVHFAAGAARPW